MKNICNAFLSAIRPMMRELRSLKLVMDRLGIIIKAEWLSSAMKRYADALS